MITGKGGGALPDSSPAGAGSMLLTGNYPWLQNLAVR